MSEMAARKSRKCKASRNPFFDKIVPGEPYPRFFGKIVPGYPPFLGEEIKGYPCPVLHERIPVLYRYGSRPEQALVQEHPCLYRSGKCRHITCASKAHHDGYECPCPAGDVTYAPGTSFVRRGGMFHEHPCVFVSGKMCHHVGCAVEANQNGYQCQQS
jgi:hypothetical protein